MVGITSFRQLIGFTVACLMVISGVMILIGTMMPAFIPTNRLRITFGVILVLFGVFRFASVYFAERRSKKTQSILEDDSWKGSSTSTD